MGDDAYDGVEDEGDTLAQQALGDIPLLDLCRMSTAEPNTLNILIVADIIFHWDVKDSYIQPTTPTSWVRDIKQIINGYPRTTTVNVYTNHDHDRLLDMKVTPLAIRELPFRPVPAFLRIGAVALLGVGDEEAELLGERVHSGAGGEIVRRLGAAV